MPIESSVIVEDRPQRDGRRYICERHTDHLGETHDLIYLAESDVDATAVMLERVAAVNSNLKDREFKRCLVAIMQGRQPVLRHLTLAEVGPMLREVYRDATGEEVAKLSGFLLTLTDSQLRTIFNLASVTNLKTRMTNRLNAWTTLQNLTGE